MAKVKVIREDKLNKKDADRILTALRQIWSWSYPRKLAIARATDKKGFGHCEKCKKKCPTLKADHIIPIGGIEPDAHKIGELIGRMFIPSKELQAICKRCHQDKTNEENRRRREREQDRALGF